MSLPAWVAEGVAEYMTESWRPYRADLEHKRHIIINPEKRDIWDPMLMDFQKCCIGQKGLVTQRLLKY